MIVVTSTLTPVTLTISGEDLALTATPLANESQGPPSYFGPLDGTLTLEAGAGLVVAKDGAPVSPAPADTNPPVTKAMIVVKGSTLELTPVASDDSGVEATFVQVGNESAREWNSPLELPLDADLSTVQFASVDVFGKFEAERTVPGNSTDADAPATAAMATPGANAAGWNTTDVTVSLVASDGHNGSGVQAVTYRLAGAESGGGVLPGAGGSVTIRSEGATTLAFAAHDRGGNSEPERTLAIRIDRTAPGTAIRAPARRYPRGARITASYACTDDGSGVGACTGPVLNGAQIDTRRLGTRRFTVNATDRAGNTAAGSVSYTVVPRRVVRCVVPNVRGKRLAGARRAIIRAHARSAACVAFARRGCARGGSSRRHPVPADACEKEPRST